MTPAIANLGDQTIITFDVWNTLIKANPEYTRHRNQLIAWAYDLDLHEAAELYTQTKFFLDQSAEIARLCMSTTDCWLMLHANIMRFLRKHQMPVKEVDVPALMNQCARAFADNLPIFTQDTKDLLARLKARGHYLGIISNTNFIPGSLLYEHLFKNLDAFRSTLFSDSYGVPKPNGRIFGETKCNLEEAAAYDVGVDEDTPSERLTAVHVGDNLVCDGRATRFGYDFQHCLSPDDLVATFKSVGL